MARVSVVTTITTGVDVTSTMEMVILTFVTSLLTLTHLLLSVSLMLLAFLLLMC
jgi:hypothetical protein